MPSSLIVPYARKSENENLTTWSVEYPFEVDGKRYYSVNQYLFCEMTRHTDDAFLLSIRGDDPALRSRFNEISNTNFFNTLKDAVENAVEIISKEDNLVHTYLQENVSNYFIYLTNDVYWGVNENGYGYNLLGQAYSSITNRIPSIYYDINEPTIYNIYKTSVLLTHHLQQGHDISPFIGKPIDIILNTLTSYTNVLFLSPSIVFDKFSKDPFFESIQLEINYPWNLAGFIRKKFANQMNYYYRRRFYGVLLRRYFGYILRRKYKDVVDMSQLKYYVEREFKKMTEMEYMEIAERIFRIYNDPDTTAKLNIFLDMTIREELYNIELQFLDPKEVDEVNRYVPFLYHIKPSKTIYITENPSFTPNIQILEPFFIVPMFKHKEKTFKSLGQFVYAQLIHKLTSFSFDRGFEILEKCSYEQECYANRLTQTIGMFKRMILRRGIRMRLKQNSSLKYLYYNTIQYGYNIEIIDPDPIIQEIVMDELWVIRQNLHTDPLYPIVFRLNPTHAIMIQDHIRFRMDDFKKVFEAYCYFQHKSKLTIDDFQYLQDTIYRDPIVFVNTTEPSLIEPFIQMFQEYCEEELIQELWKWFWCYNHLLEQNKEVRKQQTVSNIPSIISYLVKTFYTPENEMDFYVFVLSLLLGKSSTTFTPSLSYYSLELEKEYQHYLPIDEYKPEFIVNVMGITSIIQRNISNTRQVYFSYWALPYKQEPYVSSLTKMMSIPLLFPTKTRRRRKQEEEVQEEEEEQEEEQEIELREMYEELGLEDDEEEELGEDEEFEE